MRSALRISLIALAVLFPFAAREARRLLRPEPGGALAGMIGTVADTGPRAPRFPADPHGVLTAVVSITPELLSCRAPDDDFRGQLRLQLTVEATPDHAEGYVSGAWLRDPGGADAGGVRAADELRSCVVAEVEKLRFDPPKLPLTVVTSLAVFEQ
jgi:hypothetical protein